MRKVISFVLLLLPLSVFAGTLEDDWTSLLRDYVRKGSIDGIQLNALDYLSVRKDERFLQIVAELETAVVPTEPSAKMAFWINAYNILAVKVVLEKYPIKSINDIGSWRRKVWDMPAGKVGGSEVTLAYIEDEVLRKMGDPRIHVALVRASVSAPDLRNEAYSEDNLEKQLQEQMLSFVANNSKGVRMDTFGRKLYLSEVFKSFSADVGKTENDLKEALRIYLSYEMSMLLNKDTEIIYMDYDSTLNDSLRFSMR
jgi:hypothetical protein